MIITRFAPSPTGALHVGHAASALFAYRAAVEAGGRFLLRIEDIDPVRCKPAFIDGIYEDLRWLGMDWPTPVRRQSEHMADYAAALDTLKAMGLLYPCYCTRTEVEAEAAASGHAPQEGDEAGEVVYAGTCRALTLAQQEEKAALRAPVWRLDMQKALAHVKEKGGGALRWHDRGAGEVIAQPERFGDVVLARRDVKASYHLSVVVDDALQGITLVTRGADLKDSTDLHRLLQALLGLPTPEHHHHPLILGADGKRFAKRDNAATLRSMREGGMPAAEVMAQCLYA
ncbi:MAG: tRNA glutamyl-Q(34) synthetase GluQRS [Bdellovibrionales bacterium]|jgi:glutamyl-Q tRNA(Asp) synthetase